jgi:hypothetical protein
MAQNGSSGLFAHMGVFVVSRGGMGGRASYNIKESLGV